MTTAEAFREFNRGVERARRAYNNMAADEQAARARAKAVRKAASQKVYRERQKK